MNDHPFIFRWSCEQHSGAPSSGRVPSGSLDQEDQGRPPGKYVSAPEGRLQRDAQKDHCQPPAKEKEVLTHLVVHLSPLFGQTKALSILQEG